MRPYFKGFDCYDFGKVTTGGNGVTIWATYGTWANCPEGYAVTGICSSDWKAGLMFKNHSFSKAEKLCLNFNLIFNPS